MIDIKEELQELVDEYEVRIKHLGNVCQFGRYGDDDRSYYHGEYDTLENIVEALVNILSEI
jgi:hypothetical protein